MKAGMNHATDRKIASNGYNLTIYSFNNTVRIWNAGSGYFLTGQGIRPDKYYPACVVAITSVDYSGNRNLSFYMDCGYSIKKSIMDFVPARGHTIDAEGADERKQAR